MRTLLHLNIIVGRLDMLLLQRIVVLISEHLPFVLLQMGVILFMIAIIILVLRRWLVGLVRRRLMLVLDLVDAIACNWLLQGGTVEIAVPLIVN